MVTGGITGYQWEKEDEPAATGLAADINLYAGGIDHRCSIHRVDSLSLCILASF